MAARRLLIVMVVLLVISSLAAALVPPPDERTTSSSTTESTPETAPEPQPQSGEHVTHRVDASTEEPHKLRLSVGDQLSLAVTSMRFAEIAIPAFGLVESATAGSPARFDLLIEEPGTFVVRQAKPKSRRLASVVVAEPPAPEKASPSARSDEPPAPAGDRP